MLFKTSPIATPPYSITRSEMTELHLGTCEVFGFSQRGLEESQARGAGPSTHSPGQSRASGRWPPRPSPTSINTSPAHIHFRRHGSPFHSEARSLGADRLPVRVWRQDRQQRGPWQPARCAETWQDPGCRPRSQWAGSWEQAALAAQRFGSLPERELSVPRTRGDSTQVTPKTHTTRTGHSQTCVMC